MSDKASLNPDQYRLILDSLAEGVCTVDCEWNITSFNRAAQALTGVDEEKALGLTFRDLFRCELNECQLLLAGVMESGNAIHDVSTRIADYKGRPIPINLNAAPFRDDGGVIVGLVATLQDTRPIETLRRELRNEFTFGDIVSKNQNMLRILDVLPDVADSNSTVLILGPSGTGKELIARAIHNSSPRNSAPFVAVNCGALPDNLLESELFGYKKGAFTDAKRDKPGRLAAAEGGTLFLDEIGDISAAMQVRLLRVLQERQYEPLGATMSVNADVRVLAATNRDLAALVEKGEFRTDLYYRLNVIQFDLPPLSQRTEDIPLLVDRFMEKLNAEKGRGPKRVSSRVMERLMRHDYPGNIRELQNIIERAFVLCRIDEIQEECLPQSLLGSNSAPGADSNSTPQHPVNLRSLSDDQEREVIIRTLEDCNQSRKEAAARLAIDPSTLWRKMKKHGIR